MPKGSTAAALAAATRTFSTAPSLPLSTESPAAPGAHQGRRRLNGAFVIDIDRIHTDRNQPRRDFATDAQQELIDSICRVGILQPITVRYVEEEDLYRIITGERRFQAAQAAGLSEIPCWIQSPREQDILLHQITENWQRVELQPYELADALCRLREANRYTQKQLAELTGKSESDICKLLALLTLNLAAQKMARDNASGKLTRRHLYAASKLPVEQQQAFLKRVVHDEITADEAEQAVQAATAHASCKRGAPVTRIRFAVPTGTVMLTFRKKHVTLDDMLAALDAARRQAEDHTKPALNIVRPK